jgi:hypothetical protein
MTVLKQNNRIFLVAIDKLQRQYWVWQEQVVSMLVVVLCLITKETK